MATLEVIGSTSDNYCNKSDNDYATAHDAASGTASNAGAVGFFVGQINSDGLDSIRRAGIYFDASELPDDAVISAAVITLYCGSGPSAQAFNITIVNGDDLGDPMVDADYGDLLDDTTALANVVDASGWALSTAEEFTLTAGGLAKISKTATTKFGIRSSRDISSSAPVDGVTENISIWSADKTSPDYRPSLLITFTASLTVTTQTCEDVAGATATGRGNITTIGGDSVTAHGHCWATSVNPTTSDSSVDNGAASAIGAFTSAITGLTPGTGYYTKAYATSAQGTSYGANVYFVASVSRAGYTWKEGSNEHIFDENAVEQINLHQRDVDDTPVNGVTTAPISSNWAYDHLNDEDVHDAVQVNVSELGTASYDDVQDFVNMSGDRTLITGGTISDNGDGSATVGAGTAWCKESDSDTAVGKFFNFSQDASVSITALTTNFVYVDYNGGSPQIVVATSALTYGFQQDHIFVGVVYRDGSDVLHWHQSANLGIGGINRTHMRMLEHDGVHRATGMVTSSTGTRNLSVTTGFVHAGLNRQPTLAFDTSRSGTADLDEVNKLHDQDADFTEGDEGKTVHNTTDDTYGVITDYVNSGELTLATDTFPDGNEAYNIDWWSYWYYNFDGSAWVEVPGSLQINNTQYNLTSSGTGLATLSAAAKYGVHWVYMENDGQHFHLVYGQGDYFANQAEEAGTPSLLPNIVTNYCVLIAKIIIQKSTDTLIISYPWTTMFTSTLATDHGSLGGLGNDDHPQYVLITDLEDTPTEDEADKATTSEYIFDHNAASTGTHGVGTGTITSVSTANKSIYIDKEASGADDGTSWTDAFVDWDTCKDNAYPSIIGLGHTYTTYVRHGTKKTGTCDSNVANKIHDTGEFLVATTWVGRRVFNIDDGTWGVVSARDSDDQLSIINTAGVALDLCPDGDEEYSIEPTPYRETWDIDGIVVKGLLYIQAEYNWRGDCDTQGNAGEILDATADFSNVEVGDTVLVLDYNGANARLQDYEIGYVDDISQIGSDIVRTTLTKTPTANWKYIIVKTELSGSDDGTDPGTARGYVITHVDMAGVWEYGFLITWADSYSVSWTNGCRNCGIRDSILKDNDNDLYSEGSWTSSRYLGIIDTGTYGARHNYGGLLKIWDFATNAPYGVYLDYGANGYIQKACLDSATLGLYLLVGSFIKATYMVITANCTTGIRVRHNSSVYKYYDTNSATTPEDPVGTTEGAYIG